MKEEIAELIYDFAYVSGDGGTTVNPEAVDKLTDKIIEIVSCSILEKKYEK